MINLIEKFRQISINGYSVALPYVLFHLPGVIAKPNGQAADFQIMQ